MYLPTFLDIVNDENRIIIPFQLRGQLNHCLVIIIKNGGIAVNKTRHDNKCILRPKTMQICCPDVLVSQLRTHVALPSKHNALTQCWCNVATRRKGKQQ